MTPTLLAILLSLFELGFISTNVLHLHQRPYFREENVFFASTKPEIVQVVAHDGPAIDDEYALQLFIEIAQADALVKGTTFHIPEDSSLVRCFFDFQSVWNWEPENALVEGTITVRKRTRRRIDLAINLMAINRRYRSYIYKGERTFSRTNKKRPRSWNDY